MFIQKQNEKGFSYIDVMIAIVIMMVGVLAMVGALTANLMRSYEAERRIVAKQMALSTIESIITAKEIDRPGILDGWESIKNAATSPPAGSINGIFLTGWCPVREEMGYDGVAGTIDDACSGTGPCTVSGRPPNNSPLIAGYERQIVITDVPDDERPTPPNPISRRRVDVTVRFYVNKSARVETASTIVANYYSE
jgi:type II secretory pathway pseudopilin PulG